MTSKRSGGPRLALRRCGASSLEASPAEYHMLGVPLRVQLLHVNNRDMHPENHVGVGRSGICILQSRIVNWTPVALGFPRR